MVVFSKFATAVVLAASGCEAGLIKGILNFVGLRTPSNKMRGSTPISHQRRGVAAAAAPAPGFYQKKTNSVSSSPAGMDGNINTNVGNHFGGVIGGAPTMYQPFAHSHSNMDQRLAQRRAALWAQFQESQAASEKRRQESQAALEKRHQERQALMAQFQESQAASEKRRQESQAALEKQRQETQALLAQFRASIGSADLAEAAKRKAALLALLKERAARNRRT